MLSEVAEQKEIKTSESSSSLTGSGPETPSFDPNSPPPVLPSTAVTIPHLLDALNKTSTKYEGDLTVDDLDIPDDLDLTLPISTLLKLGTQRAHIKAENSGGAASLVNGTLGLEEYIKWLAVLWRIYNAMELALAEHSTDPILAPIYDPALLARAPTLSKDIIYLLSLLASSETTSDEPLQSEPSIPLPPFPLPSFLAPVFTNPPAPLSTYLDHLQNLSSSSSSAPGLLAHAYVRYLGDLSGGQFIAKKVKQAYELEGLDGTRFYWFDLQGSDKTGKAAGEGEETRADEKRRVGEVKDWFKKGMDQGVGDDQELKSHLIKEANLSFALNTHLFSLLQAPTPYTDPRYNGLRYFEIRELQKQDKLRQNLLTNGPAVPNTWWSRIERFLWFGVAAILGVVLSNYVVPFVAKYAANL